MDSRSAELLVGQDHPKFGGGGYRMGEGWELIPSADGPAIRAAWTIHLQPGDELVVPAPSWTWRGQLLARHHEQPELGAEFATKLLAAFRRCTPPGGRLWMIEWQHGWYYLDPHVAVGGWPSLLRTSGVG